jgi:hypothetical protein
LTDLSKPQRIWQELSSRQANTAMRRTWPGDFSNTAHGFEAGEFFIFLALITFNYPD